MSKIPATQRMARLIAAIPWIAAQDGVSLDEISARFDYPHSVLLEDLREVVYFVGVPPYTPDALIEVTIDDDLVWINYADWFARPMQLSGNEILALLAAGEAALAFDTGDDAGALARGLTKLRLASGANTSTVDVGLGTVAAPALATLRSASDSSCCVDITYHGFGSNTPTERRIEPSRFFLDSGRWYVGGFCQRAQAERVFRTDRISSIEKTSEPFSQPVTEDQQSATFELDNLPTVTLRAPVTSAYLFESVPVEQIERIDDRLTVTLAVASTRWLEQLMLRIGPEAEIIDSDVAIDLVSATQRIRARYDG